MASSSPKMPLLGKAPSTAPTNMRSDVEGQGSGRSSGRVARRRPESRQPVQSASDAGPTHLRDLIDAADSMESVHDLTEACRSLNTRHIVLEESYHQLIISQLTNVIDTIETFQTRAMTAPHYKIVFILYQLEQTMTASSVFAAKVMKILANEVEKHLKPAPSMQQVKMLYEKLEEWKRTPVLDSFPHDSDLHTEFGEWKDKFSWGKLGTYVLYPSKIPVDFERCYQLVAKQNEKQLQESFLKSFNVSFNAALEPYGQTKHYTGYNDTDSKILSWWGTTLEQAAIFGRYGFLDGFHFDLMFDENKTVLPWTTIGLALDNFIERGALAEAEAHPTQKLKILFGQVGTIVLPKFKSDLVQLRSLLESQTKALDTYRAKLLTGFASAAIAGGQLFASFFFHWLASHQEGNGANATMPL